MTMRAAVRVHRPRRRLLAFVALAAATVVVLAGCQADAGTAAYIGNTRITNAMVDRTADSVSNVPGATVADLRLSTLENLAFIQIAQRYARLKGYPAPAVTADQLDAYGTSLQLSPAEARTNPFVVSTATARAWTSFLLSKTPSVTPTDAELLDIYQRAVAAGLADPNSFETIKPQIASVDGLGAAIALQRDLEAQMRRYGVQTSPRYQIACTKAPCAPIEYPLLLLQTQDGSSSFHAVVLPLSAPVASPAVLDAPVTAVPQAPAS